MGSVSRVHTFASAAVLTAAQLNNEFDNLLTSSAINGGLDATNLGVTAGQITASKAIVVDSSRNLDDTTTSNMVNNLTLSGTLKMLDDQTITLGTNDDITIKYDETTNNALEIAAAVEGAALSVVMKSDQGDDAGDEWKLNIADGGVLTLGNDIASAGTYVTGLTITPNSTTASWAMDFEGDLDIGGDTLSFNSAATIDTSGNNNLTLSAGTADVVVTASNLAPASDDGSAIGVSGTAWSDLFLASGSVINFNAGDVTLTHSSNTLTVAGGTLATAALTTSTITASGIIKTDDATDATTTTDGSLQTDGGLSVVKDAIFGDDVRLLSDSAVLSLGAGNDATLTHDGTTGVTIAANPIIVDSGDSLTLDAHTGIHIFKDAGTEVLRFTESSSGQVTIKLATDGKNLVFTDNGDATNMTILDAAAGINVPGEVQTTGIGYTDGDNAITIADGGGITVPQASTFSAAITVTDTTAPLVLKYDAGEYVTHAVSSAGVYSITTTDADSDSGAITLDTVDSITLDSDTATEGIVYADSGTNLLRIHNASSDVVFKPLVDAKDIVFQQYDGNEVCRIADDRRLYFYDEGGEYLSSNGSALTIASGSAAWELPAADGSPNEVLKTDGSGNLDWVAQSGSGISFSGSTADGMVTYGSSSSAVVESTLTFASDILTATSTSANLPIIRLKNTHNGATSGILKFENDKGAAGADNDVCGTITFYGDDDAQDLIEFARIEGVVADASNGDECGALKLYVAENDGTNTVGLALTGSTTDGEIDVTVGAGTASVVTVPGHIDLAGDIDVDGTLEADAITIGGTAIGSIYGVIAGSGSIVTTGALDSGSITSGFGNIDNGSSTLDTGAATLASLVCTAAGTFGGGYGSTGATISTAGVGQFNGNLTTDGLLAAATMTLSSTSTISGDMTFVDNAKVSLGTGGDADLYYDGTNAILLPAVVGSGGLIVGYTAQGNHAGSTDQVLDVASTGGVGISLDQYSDNASGATLALAKSRSGTKGTMDYPESGDGLGTISFLGSDEGNSRFDTGCYIAAKANANWANNSSPSNIQFYTVASGYTLVKRMQINASAAPAITVTGTAGLSTGTAWTDTSDSRIKTNVQTITGALAKINSLRPVSFRYTDQYLSVHDEIDGTKTYNSFVADEYETVFPNAVSVGGDLIRVTPAVLYRSGDNDIPSDKAVGDVRTEETSETLMTDLKSYTPHDLHMYLVAAVQELSAKVTVLEAA